jgi:hypothetical protein
MLKRVYNHIPLRLQPIAKGFYSALSGNYEQSQDGGTDGEAYYPGIDEFFEPPQFEEYKEEFRKSEAEGIFADVADQYRDETIQSEAGTLELGEANLLYSVIRLTKPETVVETGVANGFSTLAILMALEKNEVGELYSVDYPRYGENPVETWLEEKGTSASEVEENAVIAPIIPQGKEPGWIIPAEYRDRWTFRQGLSQVELPTLRQQLDDIDAFLHDSEHSNSTMLFEYELAWNWLSDEGVILSDDTMLSDAFDIFVSERATSDVYRSNQLGIIKR